MEDMEHALEDGNIVLCANLECDGEIIKGDPYVMKGERMYCSQECADEDVEEG